MPITQKQAEQRMQGLGASDMAAVLEYATGKPPGTFSLYQTAGDVFWSKRPDLIPEADPEAINDRPTTYQNRGNRLEDLIVDLIRDDHAPNTLVKNQRRVGKECGGIIAANCDAILRETGEPVEIKTCEDWRTKDEWGEPGSDQVPMGYLIQVQTQIYCCERPEQGHLYAMLGWTRGLLPIGYVIPRHDGIIKSLGEAAQWFWNDHVLKGVPPKGGDIPKKLLDAIKPCKGKAQEPSEQLESLARAYAIHAELEGLHGKGREALRYQIKQLMLDAEICELANGQKITLKASKPRVTIDVAKLKKQFPEAYKALASESSPKATLRVTKPKTAEDEAED